MSGIKTKEFSHLEVGEMEGPFSASIANLRDMWVSCQGAAWLPSEGAPDRLHLPLLPKTLASCSVKR